MKGYLTVGGRVVPLTVSAYEFLLGLLGVLGTVVMTMRVMVTHTMRQQGEVIELLTRAMDRLATGNERLADELRSLQVQSVETQRLLQEVLAWLVSVRSKRRGGTG